MKKILAIILVGLMAIGNWPAVAQADDTDVFTTASVPPNVLILLDNSGSMTDPPPVGTYSPSKTYSGSYVTNDVYIRDGQTACTSVDGQDLGNVSLITPTRITSTTKSNLLSYGITQGKVSNPTACSGKYAYLMLGNYRNFLATYDPASKSKIEIARDAVNNLVSTTSGVRFGLLNYGSTNPVSNSTGGTVTIPIEDMTPANITSFTNTVTSVAQNVLNHNGTWTMLGETLQEGAAYYAGGASIYNTGVTYTSPIQQSCQKNFVIVVTDGMPTQDRDSRLTNKWNGNFRQGLGLYLNDGLDNVSNPPSQWLAPTLGIDPSFTLSAYNSWNSSFLLRDVAAFLYNTDLRSDLPGQQNVVTYVVSFGAGAGGFLPAVAQVGGGSEFDVYSGPELSAALRSAVSSIISRSFSFTSLVVPAAQTSQDNVLYSASFMPTSARPFWKGSLKAYPLDANGNPPVVADPNNPGNFILDDTKRLWSAGDSMISPTAPPRNIYTVNASGKQVPFDTNLPPGDLNVSTTNELLLIDYVNGDHGALVDWDLGDIFHSTPVVVGTPPLATSDPGFADFRKGLLNRDRMVLYGANDGMLHATYAGTSTFSYKGSTHNPGDEVWAFIPRDLLPRLVLSDPDLTASATHQYYVDSTPKVADVFIDAYGEGAKRWRTVAVTGLRKGGRSYFALDITDPTGSLVPEPTGYQYPNYLWSFVETEDTGTASIVSGQFTDTSKNWQNNQFRGFALLDSTGTRFLITGNTPTTLQVAGGTLPAVGPYRITEAGESWSQPVVGKVNVSGVAKWVAFVGGGYDSTSDPTSTASGADAYNNQSRIGGGVFVVDLGTGTMLAEFTNKRFGGIAPQMVNAMPSSVTAVDTNNDGFIDRLYIGDTEGQMWRISYTGSDPTVDINDIANWTPQMIFDASKSSARSPNSPRPIFYPPTVAFDPAIPGKVWVFFGAGNQNTPQDTTNTAQAAFFALTDMGTGSAALQWSLGYGSPDSTFAAGEKVLAASSVFNSTVYFTTYTPTAATCSGGGGSGKLYAVQYTNGYAALDYSNGYAALAPGPNTASRSTSIGAGIPSRPVFSLQTGSGGQRAQFELFISSSGTDVLLDPKAPGAVAGGPGGVPRVPGPGQLKTVRYWREL